MKPSSGPDLQRAIEFLSSPGLAAGRRAALPARPDYEFLAEYASERGYDLSPGAVQEAFRQIMRARLVLGTLSRTEGGVGEPGSSKS